MTPRGYRALSRRLLGLPGRVWCACWHRNIGACAGRERAIAYVWFFVAVTLCSAVGSALATIVLYTFWPWLQWSGWPPQWPGTPPRC
jgi:hypothetical protein